MYNGGNPNFIKEFYKSKKYNSIIIEDACHALGSKYSIKRINVGNCKYQIWQIFISSLKQSQLVKEEW